MDARGRIALGSIAGAALAALAAPYLRPFFSIPTGGVGAVTVGAYPKGWDYAVVALLIGGTFIGGALSALTAKIVAESRDADATNVSRLRGVTLVLSVIVFVLMLFVHDHPFAHMDPFHEGEHLVAGNLLKHGARPYGQFYIFHGLAVDAGLDALSLGDPPSIKHVRRLQTFLDAATLALLVPIAAEVTTTTAGLVGGVLFSLCGAAALWLPVFPYFRMAPVLLAVLGLLRYVRSGRALPLFLALASSTLGVLWSLDTGLYALAGTAGAVVVLRLVKLEARPLPLFKIAALAAIALALPFIVLVVVRADIRQFLIDSFVIMPKSIDATWALPAPAPFTEAGVRYYLPPIIYGFFLALALLMTRGAKRANAAQIVVVTILSILLFRTASGRCGWSHTRFAVPMLGLAIVAFVLEPLWRDRKRVAVIVLAIPLIVYFEVGPNIVAGAKLLAGWRARQRHEGLVPYPMQAGRGIYTSPQNAADLAALSSAVDAAGPRDGSILDFSNERALYYLLGRKPALRCMEISMLSNSDLLAEAMAQLNANPPVCVIVSGDPVIANFDGVSNRERVPDLAAWIDANYPKRTQVGRFTLATR